jgi:hypothetical protein
MHVVKQLLLDLPDEELDRLFGDELARTCREIVADVGQVAVADRYGVTDTAISHALAERGRTIPARLLTILAQMDPKARLPAFFARITGHRLVAATALSADERADLATKALLDFGPVGLERARRDGLVP